MPQLNKDGVEAALQWFDAELYGTPDSLALTEGIITAYLSTIPTHPDVGGDGVVLESYVKFTDGTTLTGADADKAMADARASAITTLTAQNASLMAERDAAIAAKNLLDTNFLDMQGELEARAEQAESSLANETARADNLTAALSDALKTIDYGRQRAYRDFPDRKKAEGAHTMATELLEAIQGSLAARAAMNLARALHIKDEANAVD